MSRSFAITLELPDEVQLHTGEGETRRATTEEAESCIRFMIIDGLCDHFDWWQEGEEIAAVTLYVTEKEE